MNSKRVIYINNINNNNNNNNNNTILDYIAITDTSSSLNDICPEVKLKYAHCTKCQISYLIKLFCHKKTCVVCQAKRARQHFNKYIEVCSEWHNHVIKDGKEYVIQFLTLTNKNVPTIDKTYIRGRDRHLKAFITRIKRNGLLADYGFINKECTYSEEKGYHYHYHILFYGPRIDLNQINISDIWRDITGDSYIVKLLSNFTNASHSLRYLLKYSCKAQETDPAMAEYYRVTKKSRNFNTFGKRYGTKQIIKTPIVCGRCGNELSKTNIGGRIRTNLTDRPRENYLVKDIDWIKIKYHNKLKDIQNKTNHHTQLKLELETTTIKQKLQRYEHMFYDDWNHDKVEDVFTLLEMKYLIERGYIFDNKGYKIL